MRTILNFIQLGPDLLTAGQPTADQLRLAVAEGVEEVVRLSTLESGLADEDAVATGLGLGYLHIPVVWTAPKPDDLTAFLAAMKSRRERRTLVHCAKNYRVSVFAGLWLIREAVWTEERARRHVADVFEPDATWRAFFEAGLEHVRRD